MRSDSDGGRLSSSDDGSSALKHDITKNTHILQLNKGITLCAAKPDLEANQASIDCTKACAKQKTNAINETSNTVCILIFTHHRQNVTDFFSIYTVSSYDKTLTLETELIASSRLKV